MNKKILLSTTIASAMFVTGMAVSAATNPYAPDEGLKVPHISQYTLQAGTTENQDTISISLAKEGTTLTKADVEKLVDEKYGTTGFVKEIITKKGENVGTGSKIVLQNGKTLTVVLYGDVDGSGVVDYFDALSALSFSAGVDANLDIFQQRAAKVALGEGLSHFDALRILSYASDPEFAETVVENDTVGELVARDTLTVAGTLKIGTISQTPATATTNVVVNGSEVTIYGNVSELTTSDLTVTIPVGAAYTTPETIDNAFNVSDKENGNLTVTMPVKEDKEGKTITITKKNDDTQSLTITVKVVNVEAPVVTKVTKATGDENLNTNMAQVVAPAEDAEKGYLDASTITVHANITLMKNYERTVNDEKVSGKWIALELATEVDEELVATGAQVEKVNGKTIVWINALSAPANITLRNVNAPISVANGKAATVYNLSLVDDSKFKVSVIGSSITAALDTADAESNAINTGLTATVATNTENTSNDKNYNVKLKVKDMASYEKGEDKVVAKWYKVNIPLTGLTAKDVSIDTSKLTKKYIVEKVADDATTLVIWFDAEEGEQVITLRHTIEESQEVQETLTIGVEVVNITSPKFATTKAENASDATYAKNMKAIDITAVTDSTANVNVWANAMTEFVPEIVATTEAKKAEGSRNNSKIWYGLAVETGIDRNLLVSDYDYVVTDSAELAKYGITSNTAVLVWVDATETARVDIKLYNKNELGADEITEGKINEDSEKEANLKITNAQKTQFGSIAEKAVSTVEATITEVVGKDNVKAYKTDLAYAPVTYTSASKKIEVTSTLNALLPYELNGASGAWVPVIIDTTVDTRALTVKLSDETIKLDNTNLVALGGTSITDSYQNNSGLLVWVDASKVGTKTVTLTKAAQEGIVPEEVVTLAVEVKATDATMRLKTVTLNPTDKVPGFDDVKYRDNYKDNVANNVTTIKSMDLENRVIELDVDLSKIKATGNRSGEVADILLLVDANVTRTALKAVAPDTTEITPGHSCASKLQIEQSNVWVADTDENSVAEWLNVAEFDGEGKLTTKAGTVVKTVEMKLSATDAVVFTVVINKK